MKSYSVKSNAKRFARGIAAKYPEKLEAIEPFQTDVDGAREWFPAVRITVKVFTPRAQQAFLDEFGAIALIQWKGLLLNGGPDPATLAEGDAGVYAIPAEDMSELAEAEGRKVIGYAKTGPQEDASGLKAMFDAVEPAGDIDSDTVTLKATALGKTDTVPVLTLENSTLVISASGRKMLQEAGAPVIGVPDSLAAMAASLPPRVESSRAEIDARRAERRARIDAEKAAGTRTASGNKVKGISKKKKILDLIAKPSGATQAELEAATGWQRHTLRGYIAGTLRKTLAPVGSIECRKVKTDDGAKETRYVFVKHEVK